jgi:hypothetical protein
VPYDHRFGLFQAGEDGPLWRASFADLDEAKRNARILADEERQEFFVSSFEDYSEVARLFPTRNKTIDLHPDSTGRIGSATGEAK